MKAATWMGAAALAVVTSAAQAGGVLPARLNNGLSGLSAAVPATAMVTSAAPASALSAPAALASLNALPSLSGDALPGLKPADPLPGLPPIAQSDLVKAVLTQLQDDPLPTVNVGLSTGWLYYDINVWPGEVNDWAGHAGVVVMLDVLELNAKIGQRPPLFAGRPIGSGECGAMPCLNPNVDGYVSYGGGLFDWISSRVLGLGGGIGPTPLPKLPGPEDIVINAGV